MQNINLHLNEKRFFLKKIIKGCDFLKKKCNYRRLLFVLLLADIISSAFFGWNTTKNAIPDTIYLSKENEKEISELLNLPFVTCEDTIQTSKGSACWVSCKLFDTIPVKKIKVQTVADNKVSVCGQPVGLYMETKGVLIIDTGEIVQEDGITCTPAQNIAKSGDYILEVNGETIQTKKELIDKIQTSEGKEITLLVARDGEKIPICIQPVKAQDFRYKLGIWVRDNTQGIGTLTFLTKEGSYGALGHGISDTDTGKLLEISQGELYEAQIVSVVKGSRGTPGELSGYIDYSEEKKLGSIETNQENGVYGTIGLKERQKLPVCEMSIGYKQEVQTGKAEILTNVEGEVKSYNAVITEIFPEYADSNKAFSIEVTDENLLAVTGGIVQGMSGSPIIQNGKLVGAVTHVFVQDSTKGYGIFAEKMLE